MLLGSLGASLFGNLWASKGVKQLKTLAMWAKISGQGVMRAGEKAIRAGQGS